MGTRSLGILLALVALAGCSEEDEEPPQVEGTGYTYAVPGGWEEATGADIEVGGFRPDSLVIAEREDDFTTNVNVVREDGLPGGVTVDDYAEASVAGLRDPAAAGLPPELVEVIEALSPTQISELRDAELGGEEAVAWEYRATQDGRRVQIRQVAAVMDGAGYTVTLTVLPDGLRRRDRRARRGRRVLELGVSAQAVQDASEAHDRRALLHRHLVVLRRPHREPLEAVLGGQLRQAGEVAPAVLRVLDERRHRHQAGDRAGAALDVGGELGGVHALLRVLARHVHLDQHLRRRVLLEPPQRRLRRDRVDQPDVRGDVLQLAALDGADEVPGEQVAVLLLLGEEVLGAVLPHEVDARLRQRGQV